MPTGLVWHERMMWHDTGSGAAVLPSGAWLEPHQHSENPDTKRRFKNLLDAVGLTAQLTLLTPLPATVEQLCRIHDRAYVERIREASLGLGGVAGSETPFGTGSYEIALLAAGGAIAAVDAVLEGRVDNAYALVRPPGHHALADTGLGFCIFANVAVAVRDAQARHGIERIAIVDWDVHHGNGTQAAFWDDPSVLAISIHQDGGYPPDSGGVDERGADAAEGTTVNIPLPPGSGSGAYLAAFERLVIPALDRFEPQLIVVASGFDAGGLDPIGRMLLPAATFGQLTLLVRAAADRHCGGRLVLSHEGGYSAGHVPFCGLSVIEALSGLSAGVDDPFAFLADLPGQELQPHQAAVLDAVQQRAR
jgi:acetoin utilization deacetylase AcuC-like enzyme